MGRLKGAGGQLRQLAVMDSYPKVLGPLALLHTQRHALAVNVADLQPADLVGAQAGPVSHRQRAWCLMLRAAAISRTASWMLNTTGTVWGSFTGFIRAINSTRPSVMSKKNFSPVSVTGKLPVSTSSS